MKDNFIECDSTGCLRVKLLPLISFISDSEEKFFACWLFNGLIALQSDPLALDKYRTIFVLQIKNLLITFQDISPRPFEYKSVGNSHPAKSVKIPKN